MKCGPVAKKRTAAATSSCSVAPHRGFAGEVLVFGGGFSVDDHAGGDTVDADLGREGLGHHLVSMCRAAFEVQ